MKKKRKTRHARSCALLFATSVLAAAGTTNTALAEEYKLDPAHSRIGFSIGHLGLSTVSGRFTNFTGTVMYEADMGTLKAEASFSADSIETGWEARDEHVRGKDFLHVKKYPKITFEAEKTKKKGDQWYLLGKLTMRGVSKKLELPVSVKGPIKDPWKKQRIGIQAEATINRQDFNVGSDKVSDNLVGDKVTLEIEAEATKVEN